MRRLLFIFILFVASVWVGIQLNKDPGYLLITFNHWSIETTLTVALVALLLSFFLFYLLLRFLHHLGNTPALIHQWLQKRRIRKAQAITQQGLKEFNEGYWSQAQNHLIKALPYSTVPLLNYLAAARAAQEMGDNPLRDSYLRQAQSSMPEAKMAIGLTHAQLQLSNQQWEQALATLKHLHELSPSQPYVLRLLMRLYIEIKDWSQLVALLPELKRYNVIPKSEYEALRHQAYSQMLASLSTSSDPNAMDNLVLSLPRPLNYDPELMGIYCDFLLQHQQDKKAEPILRRCLQRQVNPTLVKLYGQLHLDDKPLLFAESLLKQHPNSAPLYLCIGRLSLKNRLWGRAKTYFEKSIDLDSTPEAYAELGKIYQILNDEKGACSAYHEGLELANVQHEKIVPREISKKEV